MPRLRITLFTLFVLSGFCSLVYQVVWLRLAFSTFGIVTPVLSVVLSVFMLGLALGSWAAGRLSGSLAGRRGWRPLALYGLVEWAIGAGAYAVPAIFGWGGALLLGQGEASSGSYLALSALVIAVAILGFATLMGMTFPLAMDFIRAHDTTGSGNFSYLYLANVIGAMAGAFLSAALLIEIYGFHGTLGIAAALNFVTGATALAVSARTTVRRRGRPAARRPATAKKTSDTTPTQRLLLLFATGFASLAMEVVWTRAFTPVLKTTIYAFAGLLTMYLLATWIGSAVYRRHLARGRVWSTDTLLGALSFSALLPLVLNDPRWHSNTGIVLLSIVPLSALMGYLTPRLIDDHSHDDPSAAGKAYAVNVLGCIAGPLAAGYGLLPWLGVKWSLVLLALGLGAFFAARLRHMSVPRAPIAAAAVVALLAVAAGYSKSHEDPILYGSGTEVRRDYTATVISAGEGMQRRLLVNGIGITYLTPITKFMAHLPLVFRPEPPRSTLVICFGMGTTFRSLASWPGRTTAVELVPSVRDAFGYYHADAREVLARPGKQIVVDDGRRFLKRTGDRFDLITLDPPPPVEAAGSSLLYSREFYELVKQRLAPGGIVQQWFPGGRKEIGRAVLNTVRQSFPYIKVFQSIENVGFHYLASESPLEVPTVAQAVARMPASATQDLMEWFPGRTPQDVWRDMLKEEIDIRGLKERSRIAITDDRPFNEYYLLRQELDLMLWRLEQTF